MRVMYVDMIFERTASGESEVLSSATLSETVMRAVEALPEELRTAITLREVEGLSYEEIAERMDSPIGTVRSRIFRAREAIDAELRPLLDVERPAERATR